MMNYKQMKLTDRRNAFAYAVYMMVSSNFKSAFCDSPITEEWLRFQFKQQIEKAQDRLGAICAEYADRYLQEILPENIWDEKVYVVLDRDERGLHGIFLEGVDFSMMLRTSIRDLSMARITCEFVYQGRRTEYRTMVRIHERGKVTFHELNKAPGNKAVKAVPKRYAQRTADIRSLMARAMAEGILSAPEPLQDQYVFPKACPGLGQ